MRAHHIDDLLRVLPKASSRRGVLHSLALLALTAVGLRGAVDAKNKKRKKKLKLNEFGCVDVGGTCRGNDGNCCSGVCEGKKPKKGKKDKSKCVAHNVGECQADQDICVDQVSSCGAAGACYRTTGQASFCGVVGGDCFNCNKDPDCEPQFGAGAACTVCQGCETVGSTACIPAAP